ncbi:MAG: hypothetical protein AAF587_05705 [Bacteroidota bacterium]
MKHLFTLLSFLFGTFVFTAAQSNADVVKGTVSYVTSRSVYVSFENTEQIAVGDTLRVSGSNGPCLLVTNKSSSSCVCSPINDCVIAKGDEVEVALRPTSEVVDINDPPQAADPVAEPESDSPEETGTTADPPEPLYKEKIRGRFSVSDYSFLASDRDDRHRLMSRFALTADHINNSKFSFESFLTYRHIIPSDPAAIDVNTSFFRVYNLAVRYDVDPSLSIVAGRRINPKTSSLGAIDGLQAEKYLGKSYVGAIVGSRPDIGTFAVNPNLLEYGGYVGRMSDDKNFYSETTLGFIEQRNKGKIDRRYAYFQHSSTIARKLSLFSSMELDMYRSVNGVSSSELRLPNLFVSATYRPVRKVNLMISYDSRKRILYYETLQTEIERLLNDDLARQGIRARLNIRPIRYLSVGGSYSQRFQSDQQNKSDNIHAYVTVTKVPAIGGRFGVTYNNNASNYLNSNIYAARYSRSFIDNKLSAGLYYRYVDYVFKNSDLSRIQQYIGTNLSYKLTRTLVFTLAGERSDFNGETNYRIYSRIIKRFQRIKR